jgi:uncharacterized protein YmfQ (DUF2313 family)
MANPLYYATDYLAALKALLPRGRAWPKSADTVQGKTLAGLTPSFERLDGAAQSLLVDAFPTAPVNLLPEWEETFGLPDPCLGATPTLLQRQASVRARFVGTADTTAAYIIAYALQLGYVITVSSDAPFRIGINRIGDPLQGQDWFFALVIMGTDAVLQCELERIRPAYVAFIYR